MSMTRARWNDQRARIVRTGRRILALPGCRRFGRPVGQHSPADANDAVRSSPHLRGLEFSTGLLRQGQSQKICDRGFDCGEFLRRHPADGRSNTFPFHGHELIRHCPGRSDSVSVWKTHRNAVGQGLLVTGKGTDEDRVRTVGANLFVGLDDQPGSWLTVVARCRREHDIPTPYVSHGWSFNTSACSLSISASASASLANGSGATMHRRASSTTSRKGTPRARAIA